MHSPMHEEEGWKIAGMLVALSGKVDQVLGRLSATTDSARVTGLEQTIKALEQTAGELAERARTEREAQVEFNNQQSSKVAALIATEEAHAIERDRMRLRIQVVEQANTELSMRGAVSKREHCQMRLKIQAFETGATELLQRETALVAAQHKVELSNECARRRAAALEAQQTRLTEQLDALRGQNASVQDAYAKQANQLYLITAEHQKAAKAIAALEADLAYVTDGIPIDKIRSSASVDVGTIGELVDRKLIARILPTATIVDTSRTHHCGDSHVSMTIGLQTYTVLVDSKKRARESKPSRNSSHKILSDFLEKHPQLDGALMIVSPGQSLSKAACGVNYIACEREYHTLAAALWRVFATAIYKRGRKAGQGASDELKCALDRVGNGSRLSFARMHKAIAHLTRVANEERKCNSERCKRAGVVAVDAAVATTKKRRLDSGSLQTFFLPHRVGHSQ